MQACQFFNPETLNSISFWSFPIRDFPTLLRNHLLSNNQALLLPLVIFFLQFFQSLCTCSIFFTFTPHVTPKHSTLISIRYFSTFLGLTIQLGKYFFLINSREACLGPSYLETQTELPTIRLFVSVILDVSKNLNTWFTLLTAAFNLLKSTF